MRRAWPTARISPERTVNSEQRVEFGEVASEQGIGNPPIAPALAGGDPDSPQLFERAPYRVAGQVAVGGLAARDATGARFEPATFGL